MTSDPPSERSAGSAIQTVSGRWIDPLAPDLEEIRIEDIARALSNQCRFGGHSRRFYSVAQHSAIVSDVMLGSDENPELGLSALLHDATEAYLVDLPHPIKHRSELGRLYRAAEAGLAEAIRERFSLPPDDPEMKRVDRSLLATERQQLTATGVSWPELEGVEPLALEIDPWDAERAYSEFLSRYDRLERARAGLAGR